MGLASPGDVCPAPPSSGVVSARTTDERIDYVGFLAETGSVSKMAIVRRRVPRVVGRYLLGDAIAAGGMATVHLGRLVGSAGFSRTVAVKRLHGHLATNPEFVRRFVDEARIASRVRHTNVVQTLDVVSSEGELLLVLDYVHGESLARLRRLASASGVAIPPNVASGIVGGVLRGLHAAHEATSAKGAPLALVHRDVSPQNILVGADGVARVLDFGIARAAGLSEETLTRDVKGKLAYMPPEQVAGEALDRRTDLFAVGVVLWEALAGERLFRSDDIASTVDAIYNREAPRLADRGLGLLPAIDAVLARALAKDPNGRFESADAMARAVEGALAPASDREIAEWVAEIGREVLAERLAHVASFESDDTGLPKVSSSTARLFAVPPRPPESGTTRRDALIPPPLAESEPRQVVPPPDSVTSEAATPRQNPRFVGASPSPPSSGRTRIDPVERRARARTPLPMAIPIPMPAPPAGPRAPSMMWIAMLVVAAPLLVMAAVIGLRPQRTPANVERAAAASPTGVMVGSVEAAPTIAPTPPAAPMVESADAGATPTATAHPTSVRRPGRPPAHRRPPAHPVPVSVNR